MSISDNLVNDKSIKAILQTPVWRENKAKFDKIRKHLPINYDKTRAALKV